MMDTCDFCFGEFDVEDRVVATQVKPSSPDTLVAVLYGCGDCEGSSRLPTPLQLSEDLENGKLDKRIAFLML